MLAFVTTIRHPANAVSYQRTGELLDRTLASVRRQTEGDFAVVVVHNDPAPPVRFEDERIRYVSVGFPPPGKGRANQLDYGDLTFDKGTKSVIGVCAARNLGATHVMFIDADDLIDRRIAAFANARQEEPGWYSPAGYIYTLGTRFVQHMADGFNLKNGSTNVVRLDLVGVPAEISTLSTQAEILEAVGPRRVNQILGQHEEWRTAVSERGEQLAPLPFASAVWVIGTGENHSGNIVSSRERLPIDRSITEAFGLERPSRVVAGITAVTTLSRRVGRRLRVRARRG